MKRDVTTFVGFVFLGGAVMMFSLWFIMAAQHKEVVGLESWYIWGASLVGVSLIVMPQDKMVTLIMEFWEGMINKYTK